MDCPKYQKLDYWICAGDSPKQLTELYSAVTGRVPMIPEYGIGFWQCKLRYRTQEELLTVAREYKRRGLPIDAIVVDFSIGLCRVISSLIQRTGRIRRQ